MTADTNAELSRLVKATAEIAQPAVVKAAPRIVRKRVKLRYTARNGVTSAEINVGGLGEAILAGVKPHRIEPQAAQALAWAGGDHPVAIARHPGTRPLDYLTPAVKATERAGYLNGQQAALRVGLAYAADVAKAVENA